ncbi:MAG: HRDC domain-containing protein [Saprospiraceae bacterium]|nr:HRDC domain-containing protein [Saprospiraceae bacterium]
MQVRTFTIPILGGEALSEEINVFLRSKKVLSVDRHFVSNDQGAFWCFCISYLDDRNKEEQAKVDYRDVLDPESFKRFSQMREIRKQAAQKEAVPAYSILTNEEMAGLAKVEKLDAAAMKKVKGIAENKIEKYGHYFLQPQEDHEKSQSPD